MLYRSGCEVSRYLALGDLGNMLGWQLEAFEGKYALNALLRVYTKVIIIENPHLIPHTILLDRGHYSQKLQKCGNQSPRGLTDLRKAMPKCLSP